MSDTVDKIAPDEAAGPVWQRYFGIARVDHWVKNAFMLPGIALALLFVHPSGELLLWHAALGLVALCLCASANYTINDVKVTDGTGKVLFLQKNALIQGAPSGAQHTHFTMPSAVSASA